MDDFWGWDDIINRIFNSNFTGGYVPRRRDYWIKEKGIIYISDNFEILDYGDYVTMTQDLHKYAVENPEVNIKKSCEIISSMTDGEIKVNPDSAKVSFNNFILDIELEKVKE